MLDHVFLSVSDVERSIVFYTAALAPLGITTRVDYDGKDGPPGHPDLKGVRGKRPHLLLAKAGPRGPPRSARRFRCEQPE